MQPAPEYPHQMYQSPHTPPSPFSLCFQRPGIETPVKRRMFPPCLYCSLGHIALACCRTVSLQTDSTGGKCSQCSFLCSSNYSILLDLTSPLLSPSLSAITGFSHCLSLSYTLAFQMKTLTETAGSSWLKASDESVTEKERWPEVRSKH